MKNGIYNNENKIAFILEDKMEKYDFIIIGAGMGGLSIANFLAKYHKKVLVLEKHNIPGGLVTSFARKDVHFDIGIHGLFELKENQAIPQFLEFWAHHRLIQFH